MLTIDHTPYTIYTKQQIWKISLNASLWTEREYQCLLFPILIQFLCVGCSSTSFFTHSSCQSVEAKKFRVTHKQRKNKSSLFCIFKEVFFFLLSFWFSTNQTTEAHFFFFNISLVSLYHFQLKKKTKTNWMVIYWKEFFFFKLTNEGFFPILTLLSWNC